MKGAPMASSGKRKTTMAKLNRESKIRDKRAIKEARKAGRKEAAADGGTTIEPSDDTYFGRIAEDPTSV
jgi:hypothetical protein